MGTQDLNLWRNLADCLFALKCLFVFCCIGCFFVFVGILFLIIFFGSTVLNSVNIWYYFTTDVFGCFVEQRWAQSVKTKMFFVQKYRNILFACLCVSAVLCTMDTYYCTVSTFSGLGPLGCSNVCLKDIVLLCTLAPVCLCVHAIAGVQGNTPATYLVFHFQHKHTECSSD